MENKLKILINQLVKEELSLLEKKKKKEEEEITLDDTSDVDIETKEPSLDSTDIPPSDSDVSGLDLDIPSGESAEKRVGQGLQMALDAAKEMPEGDNKAKLIRQIGNTALFFLKTQIPTGGDQM